MHSFRHTNLLRASNKSLQHNLLHRESFHQNQSNTFFAAYYQRLSHHFINRTHSPYLCIKGDAFSWGHMEWRRMSATGTPFANVPVSRESLLGHHSGGRRESSAAAPAAHIQQFSGTQPPATAPQRERSWQHGCIAQMSQRAFPLRFTRLPAAFVDRCTSRAANVCWGDRI